MHCAHNAVHKVNGTVQDLGNPVTFDLESNTNYPRIQWGAGAVEPLIILRRLRQAQKKSGKLQAYMQSLLSLGPQALDRLKRTDTVTAMNNLGVIIREVKYDATNSATSSSRPLWLLPHPLIAPKF